MGGGRRNIARIAIIAIGVLMVLLLVVRLTLKSNWALEKARIIAEQEISKVIDYEVFIESLEGDLWKEISMLGLRIEPEDELLVVDSTFLAYKALSFLGKRPVIHKFHVNGVSANIEESQFLPDKGNEQTEVVEESSTDQPGLQIESINISDAYIQVYSPSYLPDSSLIVSEVHAQASLALGDQIEFGLAGLGFQIEEGTLPEPIKVNTSASMMGDEITLKELIVETGKSIVSAQAISNMSDTSLNAGISTLPLSISDIEPFLNMELPEEEMEMSISAIANSDSLTLELNLDHLYAPKFFLTTGIQLDSVLTMSHFGITGEGIDMASFTKGAIPLSFKDFRVSFGGELTPNIEASDLIWGYTFTKIQFQEYYIDRFIGSGTIIGDSLIGHVGVNPHFPNSINSYPKIHGLSTEKPEWSFGSRVHQLNLRDWVKEVDIDTDLHFSVHVNGKGFGLEEEDWHYSLTGSDRVEFLGVDTSKAGSFSPIFQYHKNEISDQQIERYALKGTLNRDRIEAEGHVQLTESKVEFEAEIENYLNEDISFVYSVFTNEFDVSEVNELANFPTSLTFNLSGQGQGIDPEECSITGSLRMENSLVNGSNIQLFNTEIILAEGILEIADGLLISDLADGEIVGRRNIADISDPENRLSFDLLLKDPQPIAGLTNFEEIKGSGEFNVSIFEDTSGTLKGDFRLDLEEIQLDSMFFASRVSGNSIIDFETAKYFETNLTIEKPILEKITLQDIELNSEGFANEDSINAVFELDVIGSDRGRLEQSGTLSGNFVEEVFEVNFEEFDFISEASELTLQQPFHVRLLKNGFGTDSLLLRSQAGAYATLGLPYFYEEEQAAFFFGENFDFGLIQDIVFGRRVLDGVFSGNMEYSRVNNEVLGRGELALKHINYKETIIDSLRFSYDIFDERLQTNGLVFWDGTPKVTGQANVPFVFDEELLDDEFFARPVSGSLIIEPSSIERFQGILNDFDIEETGGIFSFNGSVSGTAGLPFFKGSMEFQEPTISGIEVDTVSAKFEYNNSTEELDINAEIFSDNRRAAEVDLNYPFGYDFRNFILKLPENDDSLSIEVFSDELNLSLFDDFLDEEFVTDLEGNLDAELVISGTFESLVPTGYLTLTNGQLSVPYTGIALSEMIANLSFAEEQLVFHEISAKSGDGTFSLNGLMDLDGIIPSRLNLRTNAHHFELSNSRDIKMVVNMDGALTGDAMKPKATGNIELANGYYYLQEFGENLVEEIELGTPEENRFAPFDSLAIEMFFFVERDFFVRSRDYLDMEIELAGDLDIQKKTGGDMFVFGDLNSREGYMSPLGKRFDVTKGEFVFIGDPENPELSIIGKHIPQTRQKGETVELFYIIEGTAQDPEFRFESDPVMEQRDIISYTLFGMPFNALDSWQSVMAEGSGGSVAVSALADVLLDEVETLATQRLGVDVVQIDNSGTNGATSIRTGWYLNERTFFTVINEITSSTPKTLFMIEYILKENLDLIVTQGDDSRQGIELRFQHDY